ncbi:hypothetical protein [Methylorubrum sp. SB2]|uniref:hypothetical protein n=1 Tax=Methylorubrum subtropicum TaxID=3138812 RepID=UPI00313AF370
MTEPPSMRRGGRLHRDKDGFDVGTYRVQDDKLSIRVHRERGDVEWGIMERQDDGQFVFRSLHHETADADGIVGDELTVVSRVVAATGGSPLSKV